MTVVREEICGPVSPIITFSNIDEAINISNGTAFGLSSGICTNRMDDAVRFATALKVGTVNMWEVPGYRIELAPFGGIKDSGQGYKEIATNGRHLSTVRLHCRKGKVRALTCDSPQITGARQKRAGTGPN